MKTIVNSLHSPRPWGLFEFNRLPQGLCNSPVNFMHSIFWDQNSLSILCYIHDLIVFDPDERVALDRLEMVFSRLQLMAWNWHLRNVSSWEHLWSYWDTWLPRMEFQSIQMRWNVFLSCRVWTSGVWNQMAKLHPRKGLDHFWEWWTITSVLSRIIQSKQSHSLIFFKARKVELERKKLCMCLVRTENWDLRIGLKHRMVQLNSWKHH